MKPLSRSEVLRVIREHLAAELNVDPLFITEATSIQQELEGDSVTVFTLEQAIEDWYGIEVGFLASDIDTIADLVDVVVKRDETAG